MMQIWTDEGQLQDALVDLLTKHYKSYGYELEIAKRGKAVVDIRILARVSTL